MFIVVSNFQINLRGPIALLKQYPRPSIEILVGTLPEFYGLIQNKSKNFTSFPVGPFNSNFL